MVPQEKYVRVIIIYDGLNTGYRIGIEPFEAHCLTPDFIWRGSRVPVFQIFHFSSH